MHFAKLKYLLAVALGLFSALPISGQQPSRIKNAAEIKLALEKLQVLGSAMYVAAHPDDENTAVLAYLSKERNYRSAYFAMTRGDGGQNLIGAEKGTLIGIIRTQELLAARKIDGAEQFFTRAIDFGYSKSPEETLEVWGKEEILSDVVWMIRKFRPDIIITRFPTDGRGTHGHHTSSAILANEAFRIAADPAMYPDQLDALRPWQTKRIFWDKWSRRNPQALVNEPGLLRADVGAYNALLGKSYTEIAAESRSMHKSQGFGARGSRGSRFAYFELTGGVKASTDIFEGLDVSWSRIAGGERVGSLLEGASQEFQPQYAAASIPVLLQAYSEMSSLTEDHWVVLKKKELLDVIRSCAGLWIEAMVDDFATAPGEKLALRLEAINRSEFPLTLEAVTLPFGHPEVRVNAELLANKSFVLENTLKIPRDAPFTHPHWLKHEPTSGRFILTDQNDIGLAEKNSVNVRFKVSAGGQLLELETPVLYRWTDRVRGELYRKLEIRPPVAANLDEKVYLFPNDQSKAIRINLKSALANARGIVRLKSPKGWGVSPGSLPFTIQDKYGEVAVEFAIRPPANPGAGFLEIETEVGGKRFSKSLIEIHHPHIPIQSLFPPARAKLVRLDVETTAARIGYIMGSGDEIPSSLEQLGYEVTLLSDGQLENEDLSKFDAIIAGIRAYNIRDRLRHTQSRLLDYVQAGGTLVVQYNVSRGLKTDKIGPYPFQLSRDRVTVESAPLTYLVDGDHPLLSWPNQITPKDFEGWVQERGLYFPNQWADEYQAVLSSHDPGESARNGGLLYTSYGKGKFIYTGYSWFRQLPAGVPGAYRLFVNLIEAGRHGVQFN